MLAIGCDRAGYDLKLKLIEYFNENNIKYVDIGCNGETCDYPNIATALCSKIQSGECENGILCCGTGIGMSMAANKCKGIRAACCSDYFSAKMTRLHNDANVLCLGGRVLGAGLAIELAEVFIKTEFEGERHARRVDMINDLD